MIKRIVNLNTPEFPCPGNYKFTADKFLEGFRQRGIEVVEVNSLENIGSFNDSETCVFISNHFVGRGKIQNVYALGQILTEPIFICFHFNCEKQLRWNMPFKKYLITGEYLNTETYSSEIHLEGAEFAKQCKNWIPLRFASLIDPSIIGNLQRNDIYDCVFIGAPYQEEWLRRLQQDGYKTYIKIGYFNYISEEERISAFLNSRVCLGFHSDGNITNGCVVERVFEGLSLGCFVVSDNPVASKITNGTVKYVRDYLELIESITQSKDVEFFKQKQREGYAFAKQEGTYYHQAGLFLDKIQNLYG